MNTEYAAQLKRGDQLEDALKALTIDDVPLIFWTATNLEKYNKTNSALDSLKYKRKIPALLMRVEEL